MLPLRHSSPSFSLLLSGVISEYTSEPEQRRRQMNYLKYSTGGLSETNPLDFVGSVSHLFTSLAPERAIGDEGLKVSGTDVTFNDGISP